MTTQVSGCPSLEIQGQSGRWDIFWGRNFTAMEGKKCKKAYNELGEKKFDTIAEGRGGWGRELCCSLRCRLTLEKSDIWMQWLYIRFVCESLMGPK